MLREYGGLTPGEPPPPKVSKMGLLKKSYQNGSIFEQKICILNSIPNL